MMTTAVSIEITPSQNTVNPAVPQVDERVAEITQPLLSAAVSSENIQPKPQRFIAYAISGGSLDFCCMQLFRRDWVSKVIHELLERMHQADEEQAGLNITLVGVDDDDRIRIISALLISEGKLYNHRTCSTLEISCDQIRTCSKYQQFLGKWKIALVDYLKTIHIPKELTSLISAYV